MKKAELIAALVAHSEKVKEYIGRIGQRNTLARIWNMV